MDTGQAYFTYIYNKRDQFIQRCFCVVFNVTGGHGQRSQSS